MASNQIYEWDAPLVGGGGDGSTAWVAFPWAPQECFGKKNLVPVLAEFDGAAYRGSIANLGDGPIIIVVKEIRARIGKQAGDSVHVRVWQDLEKRTVEPPPELQAALDEPANLLAHDFWQSLAYSHQREYATWVASAKQATTRLARAQKAIAMLGSKQKLK